MRNLNLLFNKTYYDSLTVQTEGKKAFPAVKDMNALFLGARFSQETDYVPLEPMVSNHFLMTVCYPGLLLGLGNPHDAGAGDDEIGVGFSFDYVTGQPYIPGSTIKGVLRSHFKDHPEVIMALYKQDRLWVKALEEEIFDNSDVFFDAVVYSGNPEEKLLCEEFITPHKSPTDNPVPIRLIKILPDVRFSFRFRLKDSDHMTADEKVLLFRRLLCLFGIGAKTNVGFGILREDVNKGEPYQKPFFAAVSPDGRLQQHYYPPRNQWNNQQCTGAPSDPAGQEGKRCPHCGRRNNRFNPKNGQENWNWVKGICYNCKEKM